MTKTFLHLQNNVNDWPVAAARTAPNTLIKFVFGAERAMEAKAANHQIKTWYRWVGEQPLPSGDYENHCERWLLNFIDGTFMTKTAPYIDYIQGYNETLANSQSAEEKARWIALHTAMAKVWHERFRYNPNRPGLEHIRIILCETAVGNDIPWQIAKAAQDWNALLGYHPYIGCNINMMGLNQLSGRPVGVKVRHDAPRANFRSTTNARVPSTELYKMKETRDRASFHDMGTAYDVMGRPTYVSPHDWRWYSGRWATMDAEFVARGIKVDWAFGEMGPVRDSSPNWSGWLDPMGGWKHSGCLNGDKDKFMAVLDYWTKNMLGTPAAKEGRIKGGTLFTSGSPGSGPNWRLFEVDGDLMFKVADYTNTVPDIEPPIDPPDPPAECDGAPREQYRREMWVLPSGISAARARDIFGMAFENKVSVIYSYDDAGIGKLDDKTAVLWALSATQQPVFLAWYKEHYPCTKVEFRDLPPISLNVPLSHWIVTQRFGDNYDRYMEKWGLPGHNGIDFGVDIGTPVYAARAGTVRLVANDPDGYGKYVRIMHEDGVETYYAHLSDIVQLGPTVETGDLLGVSGNTGWSTGPHLHFGVKVDGVAVDPEGYTGPVMGVG